MSVSPARAFDYCAHNVSELLADLADAGGGGAHDGQANTIRIKSGTYATSGAPFTFGTLTTAAFTIEGGYDSACAVQDATPGGASVLDGGDSTQVLSLQSNGNLTVRHLTIQNGNYSGSAGGGASIALNNIAATGTLIFDSNVVRANANTLYSGAGLSAYGNGTFYVQNNLFVSNSGFSSALAISVTTGTYYLTNNTVADNTTSTDSNWVVSLGSATATGYVTNSIVYGNHGTNLKDYYLFGFEKVTFTYDDYASMTGTAAPGSGNNFTGIDPRFVGAGDFHLKDTSPLLGVGTLTPQGGLPATDLENNPRTLNGTVDLGAYENVDVIFASDFELL